MEARELIEQSQYFNLNEKWGDVDKINPNLIKILVDLRTKIGYPININCAYANDGHTDKSQHYMGNAVDFTISKISFVEAIQLVEQWLQGTIVIDDTEFRLDDICGFGIYPFWNTPGFHLDIRGSKARWAYDRAGRQISFTEGKRLAQSIGR